MIHWDTYIRINVPKYNVNLIKAETKSPAGFSAIFSLPQGMEFTHGDNISNYDNWANSVTVRKTVSCGGKPLKDGTFYGHFWNWSGYK